jgi:hypothetical protein
VKDKQEMINAVLRIHEIDRSLCRKSAEKQFDVSVIAKQYLSLFD